MSAVGYPGDRSCLETPTPLRANLTDPRFRVR